MTEVSARLEPEPGLALIALGETGGIGGNLECQTTVRIPSTGPAIGF